MSKSRAYAVFVMIGLMVSVAPALAGKGGSGRPSGGGGGGGSQSGSSIQLVLLDTSAPEPSFGDGVTFAVSTTATPEPWVNANCYVGGALVYSQWHGFFERYQYGQIFTLGPTQKWASGGASCQADLVNRDGGRNKTLASISFNVTP